ncbi:type II secretion system protein GspK [Hyphomicrobium facile]|uniref:General secretion pathway protein K n=1 Tax=Hyphomicrobium facile TaxID=51670 RepID=A0A1I7NRY3_9HYPH|nr:type II secretion system protein GspK [Hyphomicrobium facile]SFV37358.1 general secretion pathway protein K [Hyphomicrobium facile]
MERGDAQNSPARDAAMNGGREAGFVLLVVLWVLTSAVILVASFNAAARSGASSAISEIGLTRSEALLDAGLEIAAAHLIDEDENRRWPGNGATHSMTFAGADLEITVRDASSLIDLNKSDEKLLRSFFAKLTNSTEKAAHYTNIILDARDAASGEKRKRRDQSESDDDNEQSSTSHIAFIDVAQLGRTQGIDRDVFEKAAPFLTVFSRSGMIYPQSAPMTVLEAIPDISRADIEKIKYADKSAFDDLINKSHSYVSEESGPAYVVTVRAHRPDDTYSAVRTFVIATGLDPRAPYRLLAKLPTTSIAAEKTR